MGDSDFSIVSRQSADYSSNNITDQASAHLGNVYNHQRSVYNVNQTFNVNVQINGQNGEMSERFVRRFTNTAHTTNSREIECFARNITGRALGMAARSASEDEITSPQKVSDQRLSRANSSSRPSETSRKGRVDDMSYAQLPLYSSGFAGAKEQAQRYDRIAMTSAHSESYMSETINGVDHGAPIAQRRPPEYYCTGRVFAMFVHESGAVVTLHHQTQGILLPERRDRWVVLKSESDIRARDPDSYFLALKISTYGGQGVGKCGVVKANHGIIYSGTRCPEPSAHELPSRGESGGGMVEYPIRVQTTSKSEKLDPMSRLDYGRTYHISKSSPVYDVGMVHRDSIAALVGQFRQVLHRLTSGEDRDTEGADGDSEQSEDEQEEEA